MSDEKANVFVLAEIWIARYGAKAPAQIRQWAVDPAQSADAAAFLERIARAAEEILARDGEEKP
jgi:hypothetical protein